MSEKDAHLQWLEVTTVNVQLPKISYLIFRWLEREVATLTPVEPWRDFVEREEIFSTG